MFYEKWELCQVRSLEDKSCSSLFGSDPSESITWYSHVQPRCYMKVLLFYPYISGAMTSPGRPLSSMATLPTATQSWKGREWMREDPWQWYEVMNVFVGNPYALHVSATSTCMNRMNRWFLHPTPLADLSIRLAGEASQNKPLCRFAKIFTSPVSSLNINEIHVNMISMSRTIFVEMNHWLIIDLLVREVTITLLASPCSATFVWAGSQMCWRIWRPGHRRRLTGPDALIF